MNKQQIQKRGQGGFGLTSIIMGFVAVITGLVLFQALSPLIGVATNTVDATNDSFTVPAVGETTNLKGKAVSDVVVENSTSDDITGEFNVSNNVVVNGELTAQLVTDSNNNNVGNSVNASYTYEPQGYISDAGSRSVASLIMVFFALVVLVAAIKIAADQGIMDMAMPGN